jgi:hypothetical protein
MASVFSFCIYNPYKPLYYDGLLENIRLIQKHFPAFYTYVYIGNDVPDWFVSKIRDEKGVVLRFTNETGAKNMIHRFFAIDEVGIDTMFVRDADSRIHWKDRWAIRDFLNRSQFVAHTIRDNKHHTAKMMGGLWALRKQSGIHVKTAYAIFQKNEVDHQHAHDQNFLIDRIYPVVRPRLLVHKCEEAPAFDQEHVILFPFTYTNDIYCGRIESDFKDSPPPKSNQLLPFLRQVPTKVSGL